MHGNVEENLFSETPKKKKNKRYTIVTMSHLRDEMRER